MENKTENRTCVNCKKDFVIEPDDFGFYEKMEVPPPTFCPDCRFQRRLLFRNNRVFYKNKCVLCKKQIISLYNPNRPYTVYCYECWFSDKWDVMSYGSDYDFSIPFLKQFQSLQRAVPRANLYRKNFILSDYCNYGGDFKECYLLFGGHNNERVYFGNQILDSHDSLDVAFCEKLEFSYENFECVRVNKLFFSRYCSDCVDSYYLVDCRNCINCFGCVGLVNKTNCIFNKQYSKEEYKNILKDLFNGSYQSHLENLEKVKELKLNIPHRYARIYRSVNSDGDDLSETKNTHNSFSSRQTENSKHLFFVRGNTKDCYDNSFQGFNSELCYETAHSFGGSSGVSGVRNFHSQDFYYSNECHDCQNIFGCEGLRKKKYCILNKQYSKEEYEKLLPKIMEHMNQVPYIDAKGIIYKYGEFFPSELSPFAYNETIAQEYFPLSKDEALKQKFFWEDEEIRNYKIDIENKDIPDKIQDVNDNIIGKVITCEHGSKCMEQCTEAFKIVPEEFKFYKRMNLPLPRLCPNCRHFQRINSRNPSKLWDRKCMCDKNNHFHTTEKCEVKFKTTYATNRSEIIYCERCYQQEIY